MKHLYFDAISTPKPVAALHPVNGLLIVGVAIGLAMRSRGYLPMRRFRSAEGTSYSEPERVGV